MTNHEYSQGVCEAGAAILKDGEPMTIEEILDELKAAPAQQAGSGEAVAWDSPAVDPIVTRLYWRFKEWSQRGFTADDVTWCEVRKDVADMLNATTHPSASVPEDEYEYLHKAIELLTKQLNKAEATTPQPQSAGVTPGYTPVRTLVLKWLLGETESFEPLDGERGQFWWRKRLREAMLPTDTTPQPEPMACPGCDTEVEDLNHPEGLCDECKGIKDDNYLKSVAMATTTPHPAGKTCQWHSDDNGSWMSECGKKWYFEDGGPEENGMNFCVKCGNCCIEIGDSEDGSESYDNAM